jgi:hypothetical protein
MGDGKFVLADLACELLDVRFKTLRQYLLIGAHEQTQVAYECRSRRRRPPGSASL